MSTHSPWLPSITSRTWSLVLVVVAVALGGFAACAAFLAHHLRDGVDVGNVALTDPVATREVAVSITNVVDTIFSYDYADLARTQRAAQDVLTGRAIGQYNDLFGLVARQAPAQRLVVTVRVTACGVESLHGDRARLLVFADQTNARSPGGVTTVGVQFAVDAQRENGRWKIADIDTLSPG